MSALAIPAPFNRVYRFYQTTVGKKAIMAVTGLVLFSFVIGHLAGNLQAFEGREKMDAYGVFLRSLPAALYAARLAILISVTLHIVVTVQLARIKQVARGPVAYVKKNNSAGSYASRTMYWSGPIVGMFVVYHLAQFTYRVTDTRFIEGHIYDNLVITFQQPYISAIYIVAMVLLGLHLSHGFWSMFQSLGAASPAYSVYLKRLAQMLAAVITLGFISIPIGVLVGAIHL